MIGLVLAGVFLILSVIEVGVADALAGLLGALGIDAITALVTGDSIGAIFTGAGLADDAAMMLLGRNMTVIEKVALSVFLQEAAHTAWEAHEAESHTHEQNERYRRWLTEHEGGNTYVYGDVTPRDLIALGISGGVLLRKGTFGTLFDAFLERYGDMVTATSDVIEVVGAL